MNESKTKELESYVQDLHKEMAKFMEKKKAENQQNFLDLQTCIKDVDELGQTVSHTHSRAIENFALILACLVEKA